MNPIQGIDYGTYYSFRSFRLEKAFNLEPVMLFVNGLGGRLSIALLAVVCLTLLLLRGRLRAVLVFVGAVVLGIVLGEGLKLVVPRARPDDAEIWLGSAGLSSSFPSMAALLSSLVLYVLALAAHPYFRAWPGHRLVDVVCLVLVLLIGTSQLYLGLHFLTDVLAGWTAGLLLGVSADALASFSRRESWVTSTTADKGPP